MIGLNDSRREDPENFRLLLGAYNQTNLDSVQIIGIDLITKVGVTTGKLFKLIVRDSV